MINILKPKTWFMTDEEIKRSEARQIENERDMEERISEIDLEFGRISQEEHDKKVATLNGDPYIKVVNLDLDEKSPGAGFFELDFNEHFVEYLANSGYEGVEPDEIVDNWFNDLCQNIVMEGLEDEDGTTKSFMADSKEGLIIQRLKTDDETAEYS
jgi:hypothetical protein